MLPLKPLPIVEHWDCHSCGLCCRSATVPLDDEDLAQLQQQQWDAHPDFHGITTIRRRPIAGFKASLAKKPDGTCVFLTNEDRCRIHELHGFDAKPKICRQYPLQVVPIEGKVLVTARRSCPSAAREEGGNVADHLSDLRKTLPATLENFRPRPPAVIAGHQRTWSDTRRVTDALQRIVCDARFPLVRRMIHGLEFCDLLSGCKPRKLRKLASKDFAELIRVAEESSLETGGQWFQERAAPARGAAAAFRQTAGETLRLHHEMPLAPNWRERVTLLKTVLSVTRGRGQTPALVPGFLTLDFADLERPLGALDLELIRPLDRYFQTLTASLRYCMLSYRGWSVVEGFRALAIQYPVALWSWRWACGHELKADPLIDIIGCLDRAHTVSPLTGWRHRRRCDVLSVNGQLQRLVVWYAR